jgi:hypothetical protein
VQLSMDTTQAAAFGQAFEAILAALEDSGPQLWRPASGNAPATRSGRIGRDILRIVFGFG